MFLVVDGARLSGMLPLLKKSMKQRIRAQHGRVCGEVAIAQTAGRLAFLRLALTASKGNLGALPQGQEQDGVFQRPGQ